MKTQRDTTKNKDQIDQLVKSIVDKAKAEVRAKYGNKKRHRQ